MKAVSVAALTLGVIATCAGTAALSSAESRDARYYVHVAGPRGAITGTAYNRRGNAHQLSVLKLLRNGTLLATSRPGGYETKLTERPVAGDEIQLEAPPGTLIGSVVYDSRPTINRICAGRRSVSGQLSDASSALVNAYHVGHSRSNPVKLRSSGGTYRATFQTPLRAKARVRITQERRTTLGSGDVFAYRATAEGTARSCVSPR